MNEEKAKGFSRTKAKRFQLAIMVVIFVTVVLVFCTVQAGAVASQESADPQEQKETSHLTV